MRTRGLHKQGSTGGLHRGKVDYTEGEDRWTTQTGEDRRAKTGKDSWTIQTGEDRRAIQTGEDRWTI